MGLLLSVIVSYAGVLDAIECLKHILSGIVPEGDPDFQDLVDYYHKLLHTSSNHNSVASEDWTKLGDQGYLTLTEGENGVVKGGTIKYYNAASDSTALLFSTKISSFGQDSVDGITSNSFSNGDGRGSKTNERYTNTKTLISNTSESFSVGQRNKSPTASYENISDPTVISANSFISKEGLEAEKDEIKEKLTWHYRPLSPAPPVLPDIHFQSYEESGNKNTVYSEDYLRLILGILTHICFVCNLSHTQNISPTFKCSFLDFHSSISSPYHARNSVFIASSVNYVTHQNVNLFKIT